jgi:prepilin-type N-terminal cleavage/methylation domain-containing protein
LVALLKNYQIHNIKGEIIMKYINNEKGYTLIEFMVVLGVVGIIGCLGVGGYVLFHFISKVW